MARLVSYLKKQTQYVIVKTRHTLSQALSQINQHIKMEKSKKTTEPYSNISYGTEPTRYIKFMRVFFLKQIFDFFSLNLKIMRIVIGGHS